MDDDIFQVRFWGARGSISGIRTSILSLWRQHGLHRDALRQAYASVLDAGSGLRAGRLKRFGRACDRFRPVFHPLPLRSHHRPARFHPDL